MCSLRTDWQHTHLCLALQKPKVEGSKDDLFGADIKKNRKKTEEGYNIYSEVRRRSRCTLLGQAQSPCMGSRACDMPSGGGAC